MRYVQSDEINEFVTNAGEAENNGWLIRFRGRPECRESTRSRQIQGQLLESFGFTAWQNSKRGRPGPASWISHSSPIQVVPNPNRIPRSCLPPPRFTLSRFLYGAPRSRFPDYWLRRGIGRAIAHLFAKEAPPCFFRRARRMNSATAQRFPVKADARYLAAT